MSVATDQSNPKKIEAERFVWILALLIIFIMAARTPLDTDMWWHLRAGQVMVQTGHPLLTDTFSFTRAGQPWINHSWLAEVLLYLCYSTFGSLGLGILVAGVVTLTMAFVLLQMEGAAILKAFALVLSAVICSFVWSPRPQIFSLLFFAVLNYLLYLYKWRKVDRLWVMIPVFLLWSNLHGGYVLGFILLGCWFAGEILNKWLIDPEHTMSWKAIRRLALFSLASIFVVLINPNGINIWLIPFKTVGVGVLQQSIDEWASPDFHQVVLQSFLWLLFLIFICVSLSKRKLDGFDLVGVVVLAYMGFLAKRNFAPFGLFAGPVLTRHAWPVVEDLIERIKNILPAPQQNGRLSALNVDLPNGLRKGINLALVFFLALIAFGKVYVVTNETLVNAYIQQDYPTQALEVLESGGQEGNLLNSYGWGGYIDWSLPGSKVFVDGRTDLYGDTILEQWLTAVQAQEGWQQVLTEWNIGTVLLEPDLPLIGQLQQAGWKTLYQDDRSILMSQ